MRPQYFFYLRRAFLATELEGKTKKKSESGGSCVCILRTGSNRSSPSF
jgi:hypothetical protein